MPRSTFTILKDEDRLGLSVQEDGAAWLIEARQMLDFNLRRLAHRPMQNAFVESFNGGFTSEGLNDTLFSTLTEARSAITSRKEDYNHHRPH